MQEATGNRTAVVERCIASALFSFFVHLSLFSFSPFLSVVLRWARRAALGKHNASWQLQKHITLPDSRVPSLRRRLVYMTPAGLEPAISGSVGRCLINWATGASLPPHVDSIVLKQMLKLCVGV